MRRVFALALLAFTFILVTQAKGQGSHSIIGQVTYDNSEATPLSNVQVLLTTTGGLVLQNTSTDHLGYYSFDIPETGNYLVTAACNQPGGGVSSVNAMITLRHFVGFDTLIGLKFSAADVNSNGYVNTTDALMILRRYLDQISTFPSGDWLFETGVLTFSGTGQEMVNLKGLCYGDPVGSFIPSLLNPTDTIITTLGTVFTSPNHVVLLPIYVENLTGVGTGYYCFTYDTSFMSPVFCSFGATSICYQNMNSGLSVPNVTVLMTEINGQIYIGYFSVGGTIDIGTGLLLNLRFHTKFKTGTFPLTWCPVDLQESAYLDEIGVAIPSIFINGSVSVSP